MVVEMKQVMKWELCFDLDDIVAAKTKIHQVIVFWKRYQKPAVVVQELLGTHQVTLVGGNATRKVHGVVLALLLAREGAGKPVPALPTV
jgi:hypothetical protein